MQFLAIPKKQNTLQLWLVILLYSIATLNSPNLILFPMSFNGKKRYALIFFKRNEFKFSIESILKNGAYSISLQGVEIPIFIWYENYLHTGDGYEGRVSRVVQQNSNFGLASLNLTRIRESDQGWYLCLVNFLNRSPRQDKNGTLFHLNVHGMN